MSKFNVKIFIIFYVFFNLINTIGHTTEVKMKKSLSTKGNKLINESSPYLKQHAFNPVNWYPWGDEAFKIAKEKNIPIFLSIGYSTCHWCHVMEMESFEDKEVAKILNENFVSIKVDREERPDIDSLYMEFCQLMTGSGGWPLTIIMTPDKKPFFATTYIPKNTKHNRFGMLQLLPKISEMWKNNKKSLVESSEKILNLIKKENNIENTYSYKEIIDSCYLNLKTNYDPDTGGFSKKPKFPTPHNLLFLMRYWKHNNEKFAIEMVLNTLKNMGNGGINDQLGGGFHRYSTDSEWLIPHFEKMIYDQALLIKVYSEAYKISKDDYFKKQAISIGNYILNKMKDDLGGFYCAEDADSEGMEGKFYVFTKSQLSNILTKNELLVFAERFGVTENGNFIDPHSINTKKYNVLSVSNSIDLICKKHNLSKNKVNSLLQTAMKKVLDEREKRVHPFKDTKILTDWNGLVISGLCELYNITLDKKFLNSAKNCADFILKNGLTKDYKLLHRYKDGNYDIEGFLDDYSFLSYGLIDLYQTSFNEKYLKEAIKLTNSMIDNFYDKKNGGFFFTSNNELLKRKKEIYDGAIPSGYSVAIYNLLLLSKIVEHPDLKDIAIKSINSCSGLVSKYPSGFTFFVSNLFLIEKNSLEIIVSTNKDGEDIGAKINSMFLPEKFIFLIDDKRKNIVKSFNILKPYEFSIKEDNKKDFNIFVCDNFKCNKPINNIDEFTTQYIKTF